jgi:hypothetical protein
MVHLRWEDHFGLIPSTTILSWSWYAFMLRIFILILYLPEYVLVPPEYQITSAPGQARADAQ